MTSAKKKPTTRRKVSDTVPSHVVGRGSKVRSRMVDVSAKSTTVRTAVARARVVFPSGNAARTLRAGGPKGPIEEMARAAGVLAAKRTSDLIPLCHPLALDSIDVEFTPHGRTAIDVRCTAVCSGKTGVEMEAMVGASVAALTIYDMTKALDKGITIQSVELIEKRGGKSGIWKKRGRS